MDTARSLISYVPVKKRQRTKSTNTPDHFLKVSNVLKKISQGSDMWGFWYLKWVVRDDI